MLELLLVVANTVLFGLMMLALILGLTCVVMAFLSDKTGAEALKERIEFGFLGVSSLAIMALLAVATA